MQNFTCLWPGCESTDILAKGLCHRDHMRARRAGRLDEFKLPDRECPACGKTFAVTKHRRASCSPECAVVRRSIIWKQKRAAALPDRDCEYCLEPIPTSVRAGARHCSVVCQQAHWYLDNAEKLRARTAEWNKTHDGKRRAYRHARRAAMYCAPYERFDAWEIGDRDGWICNLCNRSIDRSRAHPDPMSKSIDHVVPLAKGGSHVRDNVAITHLVCNIKKKDRLVAAA